MHNLLLEKLRSVASSLLEVSRPAYSLRNEVLELKSIFELAAGLTVDEIAGIAAGETRTQSGVAISPMMASMCVDDFARTVQFVRGLHDAVREIRKQVSGRPTHVLYAGCGPWATLALPLMSLIPSSELTFTLLDIHEESIASARSLVDQLGLSESVEKYEIADAADYVIAGTRPDIIVIEMLRAALEAEPQVAVAMNVSRQASDAVMIPEEVRIDLTLINQGREFTFDGDGEDTTNHRDRIDAGPVFLLDKQSLKSSGTEISVTLPEFDAGIYSPMLTTAIRVYGSHLLKDYDSGITCPKALPPDVAAGPGATLEFRYELGINPGLRVRTR